MENEEAAPLIYALAPAGIEYQTNLEDYQVNGAAAIFRQPVVDRVVTHVFRLKKLGTRHVSTIALVGNPSAKVWPARGVFRTIAVEALYLYQCMPDGVDMRIWLWDALVEQFSETEVIVKQYKNAGEQVAETGMVDDGVLKRTHAQVCDAIEIEEKAQRAYVRELELAQAALSARKPKRTSSPHASGAAKTEKSPRTSQHSARQHGRNKIVQSA